MYGNVRYAFLTLVSLVVCMVAPLRSAAKGTQAVSLNGEWRFGLDPVGVGEAQGWFEPGFINYQWDIVSVPHCYTVDPRYHYYTGNAWYFKTFTAPSKTDDHRVYLRFEAVFYQATVWVNGKVAGTHEGGYTPFEFDVTDLLTATDEGKQSLAVRVNNAWGTDTIPGAKTKVDYQNLNYGQLFPWMNYGGITRQVSLLVRPRVHISSLKVDAMPDLKNGTASLKIQASIRNQSVDKVLRPDGVTAIIRLNGQPVPLRTRVVGGPVNPGLEGRFQIEASMAPDDVKLWGFDHPVLYEAEVLAGADIAKTKFGIRSVVVSGTKLLLNGEPISLGGCNRPMDYPGYGSMEPPEVLEPDMRLIKSGSMELSRISHYPVSTELMDWADRHGMLIIAEAGNWQMTPEQMRDPAMREKFRSQMREMMMRDWNHPSLIAWSLGNEYRSQTPEGQAWTRDMRAFVKEIDPTRLVTFASNIVYRPDITKPEDEASRYVDFISANLYTDHADGLKRIHALYPDKPVYVSEFGLRADSVKDEQERVGYVRDAMAAFRQCDFVIGASVWTFNDYESSFPGTNANGYRPFGLVDPERHPRAMYYAVQEEFAPAVLTFQPLETGAGAVTITARKNLPSYTMRGYTLKIGGTDFAIDQLAPGESKTVPVPGGAKSGDLVVELVKPGGFTILRTVFPAN